MSYDDDALAAIRAALREPMDATDDERAHAISRAIAESWGELSRDPVTRLHELHGLEAHESAPHEAPSHATPTEAPVVRPAHPDSVHEPAETPADHLADPFLHHNS